MSKRLVILQQNLYFSMSDYSIGKALGFAMETVNKKSFERVEKLIEEAKLQDALSILSSYKPTTDSDIYCKKLLQIQIDAHLGKVSSVFDALTDEMGKQGVLYGCVLELYETIHQVNVLLKKQSLFTDALNTLDLGLHFLSFLTDDAANIHRRRATLIHRKGIIYWQKGDFSSAEAAWLDSLHIQEELQNKSEIAAACNNLGLVYRAMGKFNNALSFYQRGLMLYRELTNKKYEAMLLNNMGIVFHDKGELYQSLENHKQSLQIREQLGDQLDIGMSLNNIGEVLQSLGDLDQALEYYQRSLAIDEEIGDQADIATSFDNLGSVYLKKGELDQALDYYKKSLQIREKIGNEAFIAVSDNEIGLVYQQKGDYEKASAHFSQALQLKKKIGNTLRIAESLYNLTILELDRGNLNRATADLQELAEINAKEKIRIINIQYRIANASILKATNRLLAKSEAYQIFQDISEDEDIINHDLTVFAMLNLCDLLLFELRTLECEESITDIKYLTDKILGIAKTQHSYSLLSQVYLLKSKLSLLELDVSGAQRLLTQARMNAEEKGLWKLALVITREHDKLLSQLNKWNELISRHSTMIERYELAQLETILGKMIQKRVEDIGNLPLFAVEYIRVSLFKMGMNGPETVLTETLSYAKDSENVLLKIGLFYTVSLGQGDNQNINTGFFGPLPIPTVENYVGLAYAFTIRDPTNTDHRSHGKTYAFLVFSMPQSIIHFFSERDFIVAMIDRELAQYSTIQEITLEKLQQLKFQVLGAS